MTYESDQQLAARGLKPLRDLPNRDDFFFVGVTRDEKEIECVVHWDDQSYLVEFIGVHNPPVNYSDLIGWRDT